MLLLERRAERRERERRRRTERSQQHTSEVSLFGNVFASFKRLHRLQHNLCIHVRPRTKIRKNRPFVLSLPRVPKLRKIKEKHERRPTANEGEVNCRFCRTISNSSGVCVLGDAERQKKTRRKRASNRISTVYAIQCLPPSRRSSLPREDS